MSLICPRESQGTGWADVSSRVIDLKRQNEELLAVNWMLQKRVKELNFLHEVLTGLIKN